MASAIVATKATTTGHHRAIRRHGRSPGKKSPTTIPPEYANFDIRQH
ncbi:hypothetical protein [Mycobacterium sp. 360MFTsu5.1]|nr:hypothetical protein [Mycobacterium sp. 360MFTsu5.1]